MRERRHTGRLLTLTVAAAGADAASYLGLGHVFPANMTGNTVLLAIHVAGRDYRSATRSAVALGGFVFGAALTAVAAGSGRGWSRRLRGVLLAELLLVAAAAGWWLSLEAHPVGAARFGLIALLSVAMGIQSGAITSLQVGVSTTYITGTWTAVSAWAASRLRHPDPAGCDDADDTDRHAVQRTVLLCYFASALGTGYLFHAHGAAALLIAVAALAVVCAWAFSSCRPRHLRAGAPTARS